MSKPNILMVVTSQPQIGTTGTPGGYWFEELAAPFYVFKDAGFDVTIASIKGGRPPRDPWSETADWTTDATLRFSSDPEAEALVAQSRPIDAIDPRNKDAVFLVGGISAMWDFAESEELARIVEAIDRKGDVVASVCHGAAGLVRAKRADGQPFVKGRRIVSWTDAEEALIQMQDNVPFLLEARLRELGGAFVAGENLKSTVRMDGRLITGQNPASSRETALAVAGAVHSRFDQAA